MQREVDDTRDKLLQAVTAGKAAAVRCGELEEMERECSELRAEVARLETAAEDVSYATVTCARRVGDVLLNLEITM